MKRLADLDHPETANPAEESTATRLRRSPLTDPRALILSLVIHGILLVVGSYLAFRVGSSTVIEPKVGRVMPGELDATDNRATGDPGGSSGDPEGRAADLSAEPGIPSPTSKDAAADALLSEILPTRDLADLPSQTLPGPSTSGLGMLNATGTGEGGASSGNTSGGGGKGGTGPGTEFFGVRDQGRSFAYVIDCSSSMTARGSLNVAKRELLTSLDRISADTRFSVIMYNLEATVFTDPSDRPGLMSATPENKKRVRALLATVEPDGFTDHMHALRTAFKFQPEVIFFLTDGDMLTRQDVTQLVKQSGGSRIQVIEFGQITGADGSASLKLLARSTGGTYRYVDVNTFGR